MKKIQFLLVTAFLFVAMSVQAQIKSKPIAVLNDISVDKITLIDVRTPEEFDAGHVENAVNINVYDKDFAKKVQALNTKKPIYVYCRSGHRSMNAAKILNELGIGVTNLEGGFNAYSALRPIPNN